MKKNQESEFEMPGRYSKKTFWLCKFVVKKGNLNRKVTRVTSKAWTGYNYYGEGGDRK